MFKPLYDSVIVEPEPVESYEKQMGYTNVIVPDRYKVGPSDPPIWGKVIGVGDSVNEENPYYPIEVGSRVLFGKFAGARFKYEGTDYIAVKSHDVLAVDR